MLRRRLHRSALYAVALAEAGVAVTLPFVELVELAHANVVHHDVVMLRGPSVVCIACNAGSRCSAICCSSASLHCTNQKPLGADFL